jgi:small subunit ribosomal protein S1
LPGGQAADGRITGCSGEAGGDDGVVLPYTYEVTKYDPAGRDSKGHYTGARDLVSDHGPLEAAYLRAVADFAAETGIGQLAIREPQITASVHFGLEPAIDGHGLAGLFPPDLTGYYDGAVVPVAVAVELVRAMLRDNGAWCRLEAEGQLTVHVGWDQYLWVASTAPCQAALARAREAGLFPERVDASPYAFAPDELEMQRPAGDEFWARLAWCVQTGQAAILEESPVHNMSRWHQLTAGTLEEVRARLAPRAMLTVWPDMPWRDAGAVLSTLRQDPREVELVCTDAAGHIWSVTADGEWPPGDLAQVTAGAAQAAILETTLDNRHPLMTGVLPDHDGVMRARWGNPPAPSDRRWALMKNLRPGEAVTGTVTSISDDGTASVDIGGVTAMTSAPAHPGEPFRRPAAVGQQVTATVLQVDTIREQVTLTLRA